MALFNHHFDIPEVDEQDFYLYVLNIHYSIGVVFTIENYPNYFEAVYKMICRDLD